MFWEVATGLGGVVGKKGAGDGGFHIKIFFFIYMGIIWCPPRNMYKQ